MNKNLTVVISVPFSYPNSTFPFLSLVPLKFLTSLSSIIIYTHIHTKTKTCKHKQTQLYKCSLLSLISTAFVRAPNLYTPAFLVLCQKYTLFTDIGVYLTLLDANKSQNAIALFLETF